MSPLHLLGSGREKDVYEVGQEAWALNREDSESAQWVGASVCLHNILRILFPNNFPELKDIVHTMEDKPNTLQKRVLRVLQKVEGKSLHPLFGQLRQKSIDALSNELESVGILAALDPVPQNFILQKKNSHAQLVYVDTPNPYTFDKQGKPHQRTIDTQRLRNFIQDRYGNLHDENVRATLLDLIHKYEELTPNMTPCHPQSYWKAHPHQ